LSRECRGRESPARPAPAAGLCMPIPIQGARCNSNAVCCRARSGPHCAGGLQPRHTVWKSRQLTVAMGQVRPIGPCLSRLGGPWRSNTGSCRFVMKTTDVIATSAGYPRNAPAQIVERRRSIRTASGRRPHAQRRRSVELLGQHSQTRRQIRLVAREPWAAGRYAGLPTIETSSGRARFKVAGVRRVLEIGIQPGLNERRPSALAGAETPRSVR
jgi:hypothetical protein